MTLLLSNLLGGISEFASPTLAMEAIIFEIESNNCVEFATKQMDLTPTFEDGKAVFKGLKGSLNEGIKFSIKQVESDSMTGMPQFKIKFKGVLEGEKRKGKTTAAIVELSSKFEKFAEEMLILK